MSTDDSYCEVVWRVFGFAGGHASVSSAARAAARGVVGAPVRRESACSCATPATGGTSSWPRTRPIAAGAGRAGVELRGAGRAGGCGRRDRRREGEMSLLANQVQADDCFWVQRVECAPAAGAPAAAGGWIVGPGADVARRVVAQGAAVLERGVPLSARRAARPVPVSGGVCRVGAAARSMCRRRSRRSCEAHVKVTHRNEALLAEISQINLELLRRRALE